MRLNIRGKILVIILVLSIGFGLNETLLKGKAIIESTNPIEYNYAINEFENILEEKIYEKGERFVNEFDYMNNDLKEYATDVTYNIIMDTMTVIDNKNNITFNDLVENGTIVELTNLTMKILNDNYNKE